MSADLRISMLDVGRWMLDVFRGCSFISCFAIILASSAFAADMAAQQPVYIFTIDRAKQQIGLSGPDGRIRFAVERKLPDGKRITQRLNSLPVCTKTVRLMAPEGPKIPNDPYGKYCELPPADGKDGMWYKVGPIEEVPRGSLDFGFYKIDLTGKPADTHGRSGLLIHGGGKKLPDPRADFQGWQCTHGCVRMQNIHLRALVAALRSLPPDADFRLVVDEGKCRINGIVAETYRWDARTREWLMVDG